MKHSGFAKERCPSRLPQESLTYALIWHLLLEDYALWHRDSEWMSNRLAAARAQMANLVLYEDLDGLLSTLPGWSFVDPVANWRGGLPPGSESGSSIVNLLYVNALLATARLERHYGDSGQAAVYEARASRCMPVNTAAQSGFSQHAQSLAVLTGLLNTGMKEACLDALVTNDTLEQVNIYFSFYLLEALFRNGRGKEAFMHLEKWKVITDANMRTHGRLIRCIFCTPQLRASAPQDTASTASSCDPVRGN